MVVSLHLVKNKLLFRGLFMDIKEIKSEKSKKVYQVVIPAKTIAELTNQKLQKIASDVKLQGFRQGKAPVAMIEKQYKGQALSDALESATNDAVNKIFVDFKPRALSQPRVSLESFEADKDAIISVELDLFPEIKEVDFAKFKLETTKLEITDKEVNESLDQIANYYKKFEDLTENRPTQLGDVAVINFLGKVNDVLFDGGKGEDFPLELGSNMFIPGFEEQVVGKNVGDKFEVSVPFPKDYHAKHLAGQNSVFEVEIIKIQAVAKANLDDELAKKNGFDTLDALKEDIVKRYSEHTKTLELQLNKKVVLDKLEELEGIEIPENLLIQEEENLWKEFLHMKEHMKQHEAKADYDAHGHSQEEIDMYKKSDEEVKKDNKVKAEKRLKLGLLLNDIAVKNNIAVLDEDIQALLANEARAYNRDVKSLLSLYRSNPEAYKTLQGRILEDKVVSFILSKAKCSDKKIPFSEYNK
jgi:trigger factor